MNLLVRARRKFKLSGYQVAKAAKIDRSYYRKIEIGTYTPSPEFATKIAEAINELAGTQVVTASEIVFMKLKSRAKSKSLKAA